MEHAFADWASEPPTVAFHSPVGLTSNRERTPQGWLRIKDVVIARTGVQDYHGSELPMEPGPLGYIVVERSAEDLFTPEAIASFEGVPIVDEHPRDASGLTMMLNASNTREHLHGVLNNVRRGEGDRAHCLVGDATLYTDAAIAAVENGKRQVSAGYTASYMRLEPGRGRQVNFRGNHLAIVHRGRCGAECAFGDEEHTMTEPTPGAVAKPAATIIARRSPVPAMPLRDVRYARIMHAVRTGDEDLVAAELAAALPVEAPLDVADPLADIRTALATLTDGLAALAARMDAAEKAPAAAAEVAKEVQQVAEAAADLASEALPDELTTDAAWRDTISRAEVLSPGLAVPTGDSVATPKGRGVAILAHQRRALNAAFDAHPDAIRPLFGTTGKPAFDKMPAIALRGFFIAASENASRARTAAATRPAIPTGDAAAPKGPQTPAEINARAREVWGAQR